MDINFSRVGACPPPPPTAVTFTSTKVLAGSGLGALTQIRPQHNRMPLIYTKLEQLPINQRWWKINASPIKVKVRQNSPMTFPVHIYVYPQTVNQKFHLASHKLWTLCGIIIHQAGYSCRVWNLSSGSQNQHCCGFCVRLSQEVNRQECAVELTSGTPVLLTVFEVYPRGWLTRVLAHLTRPPATWGVGREIDFPRNPWKFG